MSNSLGQIRQRSPAHWSARWLLAAHTHTRWFKKGKISDFFKWPIFSGLSRVGYSLKCFSVGFLSLLSEDPATWPVSCVTACKKKNTNSVSALFCHHGVFMHSFMLLFFSFVTTFFLFHFGLTDCSWLLEIRFIRCSCFLYLFSLCTVRGHMRLSIIKRVTVNDALNDFHVKCPQSFYWQSVHSAMTRRVRYSQAQPSGVYDDITSQLFWGKWLCCR